ncbi:MAG: fumarylacetoacetate hydrolase family protein [Thermoplasmatota archaeon]
MRLCTFRSYAYEEAGIVLNGRVVGLEDLNDAWGQDFGPTLGALLKRGQADELARMMRSPPRLITSGWKPERLKYVAPYRDPPKIWGVGLNFREHARDMTDDPPDEPTGFMRPTTAIADPGAPLRLPQGLGRITGEAEIGVIMGKRCKDATPAEARDAVLGFTTLLDLTAEEMLKKNARLLTRAKAFDDSFVFGPFIVTRDEWEFSDATRIRTTHDGKTAREGAVAEMKMKPYELVADHSRLFAWEPGDILLTGTPGAVPLGSGQRVGCEVDGLGVLENPIA